MASRGGSGPSVRELSGERLAGAYRRVLRRGSRITPASPAEALHDLFAALVADLGVGAVVVTHNRLLAARATRVLLLDDGHLADTSVSEGMV